MVCLSEGECYRWPNEMDLSVGDFLARDAFGDGSAELSGEKGVFCGAAFL